MTYSIFVRSVRILGLGLVVALVLVCATRPDAVNRLTGPTEAVDPCRSPLAWHIRSADPRFGFTRAELQRAVEEAAGVWNRTAERQLFRHDTAGSMAIDLVYDERQRALEARRDREASLEALRAEAEQLEARLEGARVRAEQARATYERDPTEDRQRTLRERIERYNDVANRYNRTVARYNEALEAARVEGPVEARAGDLRSRTTIVGDRVVRIDRALSVALAGDYAELVAVLAHELGHALGLGHVSDPDALMAERYRRSDISLPVRLTQADRRALAELCDPDGRG